jgi:hypothetical protein
LTDISESFGGRHTSRPILIFDTSGINRLADDSESKILAAGLQSSFFVRVTESSLSEILATPDPTRRKHLLDCLKRLCSGGECIVPYQWVIERLIRHFTNRPTSFDWRKVPVRCRQYEAEITRQQIINEELAAKQWQQARILRKQFDDIYKKIQVNLEPLLNDPANQRPSIGEFIETSKRSIWTLGTILYDGFARKPCDEDVLQSFYRLCPPFRTLLIALLMAGYERCVRDIKRDQSYRAGRMDLLMATYLPYCHQFIGTDAKQLRCLELIALEGDVDVYIRHYDNLRSGITGI